MVQNSTAEGGGYPPIPQLIVFTTYIDQKMAVLGTWNFSENSSVLVASHFHFWSILENNVSLIFQDTKFGILILKGIWSPNHLPPPPFLPQKLWLWNFLTNIKSDYVPSAEN